MARTEQTRMEFINRGKLEGFRKYFSNRKEYFQDIFNRGYSEQAAAEEFNNIRAMIWKSGEVES